jgi:hypothetical protein
MKPGLALGWLDCEIFQLPDWRRRGGRLACPFTARLGADLGGIILLRFGLFEVRRVTGALVY